MKIRFVVHFADADSEVVIGRDVLDPEIVSKGTGWRDLPDKPIARLSLVNPHGDLITLQGYEEYNFMVESLQALGQASYVSDVYAMGARDGKVTSYRMRLMRRSLSDPLQVGDITARVIERGKEYLGAETTGWRKGMLKIRHPFGFAQGKSCLRQIRRGELLGGGLKSSNV